mgnify:CR=1 FL=1
MCVISKSAQRSHHAATSPLSGYNRACLGKGNDNDDDDDDPGRQQQRRQRQRRHVNKHIHDHHHEHTTTKTKYQKRAPKTRERTTGDDACNGWWSVKMSDKLRPSAVDRWLDGRRSTVDGRRSVDFDRLNGQHEGR